MTLNSKVQIDHDVSSFNMVEYEKGDRKAQYDQQLILAKLKRLENNVEMKRADMELEQRKKKIFKTKKSNESILNEKNHYLNTFKKFQEDK
jgi:vancomycin resistance protein YoaR